MIPLTLLYYHFLSWTNNYIGGWFRPNSDFERVANDISMERWDHYTRILEKTQEVTDKLAAFFVSHNITTKPVDRYAVFKYPADYSRFSAARIVVAGNGECQPSRDVDGGKCWAHDRILDDVQMKEMFEKFQDDVKERYVDKIDDQRWGSVMEHVTKGPTLERPKLMQIEGGFRVAPRQISVVVLDYYKEPEYVKFVYTTTQPNVITGSGDQIIFNEEESGKLPWPRTMINEFLVPLAMHYSSFTRDQVLAQLENLSNRP